MVLLKETTSTLNTLQKKGTEYVLLLNNDVIVTRDFLDVLVNQEEGIQRQESLVQESAGMMDQEGFRQWEPASTSWGTKTDHVFVM